jgi:hypothetical protein
MGIRPARVCRFRVIEASFFKEVNHGMGANLHAIPWGALTLDTDEKCFFLDITAQRLKDDPGFDKDHWPTMADAKWGMSMHSYYNREPYWTATQEVVETDPTVRPSEH